MNMAGSLLQRNFNICVMFIAYVPSFVSKDNCKRQNHYLFVRETFVTTWLALRQS